MPGELWLDPAELSRCARRALEEDVGPGDVTTLSIVAAGTWARASIVARNPGILAGMPVAAAVFHALDARARLIPGCEEGAAFSTGDRLAVVEGSARALLTGERVALNFLQHLSAIATQTAELVALAAGLDVQIVDTRKTIPGLRMLARYAVRAGGGRNHRSGLFDGVLIKDNHILAAGGIAAAVARARSAAPHVLRIEVEAETLPEVDEALAAGADVILLDNMEAVVMRLAVERCRGKALTEASGGIDGRTLRQVAETGVDFISVGALTHSVAALDLSMELERVCSVDPDEPAA